jgi:hypothetical protein
MNSRDDKLMQEISSNWEDDVLGQIEINSTAVKGSSNNQRFNASMLTPINLNR